MRENAAAKATRILCEGRLILTQVQPGIVRATTRGEGHLWHQAYENGGWSCTCPARNRPVLPPPRPQTSDSHRHRRSNMTIPDLPCGHPRAHPVQLCRTCILHSAEFDKHPGTQVIDVAWGVDQINDGRARLAQITLTPEQYDLAQQLAQLGQPNDDDTTGKGAGQ